MNTILGNGAELARPRAHPYLGRQAVSRPDEREAALAELNKGRGACREEAVEVVYYYELATQAPPMQTLIRTARDVLGLGTLKPWEKEGPAAQAKPAGYDNYMSWATDIQLLGYNGDCGVESGLLTVAYPLTFFDKRADGRVSLAQMLESIAGEAMYAFEHYLGARIVSLRLPPSLLARCPKPRWPGTRVRRYLGVSGDAPLIGTIVKPKTGLTPELFSACVVEAAVAGACFTKADENMHLRLQDVSRFVGRVVKDLERAGFDLGSGEAGRKRRFLFAPHVTADADNIGAYAKAAVEAGANALMFSPYCGGGFLQMAEIAERFDVPLYAHTAGMNVFCGCPAWGIDAKVMYLLSGLFGAAFMQLPAMDGYLKPLDVEKPAILEYLRQYGLEGENGMTLAIAGGLGPANIGRNCKALGQAGRMFLAGSSVYSHPDGVAKGVQALLCAYRAFQQQGIVEAAALREYAQALGREGQALCRALGGTERKK